MGDLFSSSFVHEGLFVEYYRLLEQIFWGVFLYYWKRRLQYQDIHNDSLFSLLLSVFLIVYLLLIELLIFESKYSLDIFVNVPLLILKLFLRNILADPNKINISNNNLLFVCLLFLLLVRFSMSLQFLYLFLLLTFSRKTLIIFFSCLD